MTTPPPIDPKTSKLFATMLRTNHWRVRAWMSKAPFPDFEAEKAEVEAYVAAVQSTILGGDAAGLTERYAAYLHGMFLPHEIEAAELAGNLARLTALAVLNDAVNDARYEIRQKSLLPPRADDPVFESRRELFESLDRDGLFDLTPQGVSDERLSREGLLSYRGLVLHPHPFLTPLRELVATLFELANDPSLRVRIALDPFVVSTPDQVQAQLLEDHWYGIKTNPETLDSLDPHDVGVRTFHFARQDNPLRHFQPLLGTWFDWERRDRHDATDPVKRLYIREVRPCRDTDGERFEAIVNPELHAERDTVARRFTHVDGKVCQYDSDDYLPSAEHPDAPLGKASRSRKLWRVDGDIGDGLWQELVGLHFRGNELIDEHFGAAFPGQVTQ